MIVAMRLALYTTDQQIQIRVQGRLAPAERDDCRSQIRQLVHSPDHFVCGHRRGRLVELITVGAGQIAAADRNDLRQDGDGAGRPCSARTYGPHATFAVL